MADTSLSPDERASVLLRRADWFAESGELEHAYQDLLAAKARVHDEVLRERTQASLRKILLRLGDEARIDQHLLNVPLPEDAFAYCRRGADALLCRGRQAAAGWYSEALRIARSGDEKVAALMGIQATQDPGDWSRAIQLDRERLAIPIEDRPKAQQVSTLSSEAGGELLRVAREGGMRHPLNTQAAVRKLREALDLADEMGWPKCPSANATTAADSTAYELLGLYLQDKSELEQTRKGFVLAIERGLMRLEKHFTVDQVERATSTAADVTWVRQQVASRSEAAYMSRSRALLRTVFLVALPDEAIEEHVIGALPGVDALKWRLWDSSMPQLQAALLKNQLAWLPRKAVLHVVELASQLMARDTGERDVLEDWEMPIADWAGDGSLTRDDPPVAQLIQAVATRLGDHAFGKNWREQRQVLGIVEQLQEACLLTQETLETLRRAVEAQIDAARARDPDGVTGILELALCRHALGDWNPGPEVIDAFLQGFQSLHRSSAIGTWVNALDFVTPHLGTELGTRVRGFVEDYIEETLRERVRPFGPSPYVAALAVHQAAKASLYSVEEGATRLGRLIERYPECAPFVLELPGIDPTVAEAKMLQAQARGDLPRHVLLRWCNWIPEGAQGSPRLERVLLGMLYADDSKSRQEAYWGLGHLARRQALSAEGKAALADTVRLAGRCDPAGRARAAAVTAIERIFDAFSEKELEEFTASALADDLAPVRRAGRTLANRSGREAPGAQSAT